MDEVVRHAESSLVAAINVVVDVLVWILAVGFALLWAMLLPPNNLPLRRAFLWLFFGCAAICWRVAISRVFGMAPGLVDAVWALGCYGTTLGAVPLAVREAAVMRFGTTDPRVVVGTIRADVAEWRRR